MNLKQEIKDNNGDVVFNNLKTTVHHAALLSRWSNVFIKY